MKKRYAFSSFVALMLAVTILCYTPAFAADLEPFRASPTLHSYAAMITQGDGAGELDINYDVTANTTAQSVGVLKIRIYKADGTFVTTIWSSLTPSLVGSDTVRHRSFYTYTGKSGTYYYAVVTVFATIDGVSDSREITTNTVKAP